MNLCIVKDCDNKAFYGFITDYKKLYCSKHKNTEENLINIRNKNNYCKSCIYKIGYYFYKDKPFDKYCGNCKLPEMISKYLCDKCNKTSPSFGFLEDNIIKRCYNCKDEGMINLSTLKKICEKCKIKRSSFGFLEDNIVKRCKDCKDEGMINLYKKYNICDKCNKIEAIFGYKENNKRLRCFKCKDDDMINLNKIICDKCNKTTAIFGHKENNKRLRCFKCKDDDMIDLSHKLCIANNKNNILCLSRGNKIYDNYCSRCFAYLFPLHELTTKIKTKTFELKVKMFIDNNYSGFIHNKIINIGGGCDCRYKRLIDHFIYIDGCLLAIETDENKHISYNKEDEINRYNDIMMIYTFPHYFIRFNPNTSYRDKNGNIKNPLFTNRIKVLKNEIDNALTLIKSQEIYKKENILTIKYLYYNE
jgi:hypothetical protein